MEPGGEEVQAQQGNGEAEESEGVFPLAGVPSSFSGVRSLTRFQNQEQKRPSGIFVG